MSFQGWLSIEKEGLHQQARRVTIVKTNEEWTHHSSPITKSRNGSMELAWICNADISYPPDWTYVGGLPFHYQAYTYMKLITSVGIKLDEYKLKPERGRRVSRINEWQTHTISYFPHTWKRKKGISRSLRFCSSSFNPLSINPNCRALAPKNWSNRLNATATEVSILLAWSTAWINAQLSLDRWSLNIQ